MNEGRLCVDVSVIICAYSEARFNLLEQAVESIRSQSVQPHEIIAVIDHNPALVSPLRRAFSGIVVVENAGRKGISGARNTGITRARGSIVAFMDDDAEADFDWLKTLVAPYRMPKVLGVGGSIQALWPDKRPAWLPAEFLWVVGCSYRGLPSEAGQIRNLYGANMSFRRQILEAAGGFNAALGRTATQPLGCEETEMCIRIGQMWPSGELLYEPAAVVRHTVAGERIELRYFLRRCFCEGVSKAAVVASAGSGAVLSSERIHVLRTIPTGIGRELAALALGLDGWAMARVVAMLAGLAATVAGYLVGRAWSGRGRVAAIPSGRFSA